MVLFVAVIVDVRFFFFFFLCVCVCVCVCVRLIRIKEWIKSLHGQTECKPLLALL